METSYLKGHDLLREVESLPPLPVTMSREPTPPLVPSRASDSDGSDSDSESPSTPVSLHTLAAESKVLYREVIKYASTPKIVDLSASRANRGDRAEGKLWLPRKKTPAYQIWERRQEGERLGKRLKGLLERTSNLQAISG